MRLTAPTIFFLWWFFLLLQIQFVHCAPFCPLFQHLVLSFCLTTISHLHSSQGIYIWLHFLYSGNQWFTINIGTSRFWVHDLYQYLDRYLDLFSKICRTYHMLCLRSEVLCSWLLFSDSVKLLWKCDPHRSVRLEISYSARGFIILL